MASKASASLDAWLAQAEEVLEEQRERSLSPSSAPTWDAGEVEQVITLAEFSDGLEGVLTALSGRPGRWILIAETGGPHRYWQALCYEDGSLWAEVVSNTWIEDDPQLSVEQEEGLEALDWGVPVPPGYPNWWRIEATTSPDVAGVTRQALETLREVFGAGDGDKVTVKLFSSPRRGKTPASPEYVEDDGEGESELIDPWGGPEEEDPDLYPDPTADDPPFGDEPLDEDED